MSSFQTQVANVVGNPKVREPQQESYAALQRLNADPGSSREVGIILPVGCGKSGAIALAPYALGSARVLVIAPGLAIAEQLEKDFHPANGNAFYTKCAVLAPNQFPESSPIRGKSVNRADLDQAEVVITNIQQLQGADNPWLAILPDDYFDTILFDEGHHSVAESWEALKTAFPKARIVNFSATPTRADGQVMAGEVIYSYSIFKAIEAGFVKRLKAIQLNPKTLRYVRHQDGQEIEVGLEEVRRLGEEDSDFRRSIVTSEETLATIVDASLHEIDRLRAETGEKRLKVIASALNYQHCQQIVKAYRSRGRTADYVHSREDAKSNKIIMQKLENHELDVIVQVRKLGEGFDHPYLAVAAVLSVFSNLAPFVQFVGRIMRVIKQNAPNDPINNGTVIFHAGANIARQWADFRQFSNADQSYFEQLLPLEGIEPTSTEPQREYEPRPVGNEHEVKSQGDVRLEELPLVSQDAADAIRLLQAQGIIAPDFDPSTQILQPIQTRKVDVRRASRQALDERIKHTAGQLLLQQKLPFDGKALDKKRLGRTNYQIVVGALSEQANILVGRGVRERSDMTQAELDTIAGNFEAIVQAVTEKL
ncbi:DEAD/DEAH box helicase [Xanthomonas arboricola]|uniref:DEAD/DEAH box helicase n=1 Tax=Xanthomonas arboricola TaxID=56448 RepID=UPI002B31F962|nr:DEAD/DEAH box helicase family protein [Xanthomonas arboricola]